MLQYENSQSFKSQTIMLRVSQSNDDQGHFLIGFIGKC